MTKRFRRKQLTCGCCGAYFHTWKGYVDQDQDKGYGICLKCQEWQVERNNEQLDKIGASIRGALNNANTVKWDGLDLETRRLLAMKCVDDGLVTWAFSDTHMERIGLGQSSPFAKEARNEN